MAAKPSLVDGQTRTVETDDRIMINHTDTGVVVDRDYKRTVRVDGQRVTGHGRHCSVPVEVAAFLPACGYAQYEELPTEAQELIDAYTTFEIPEDADRRRSDSDDW